MTLAASSREILLPALREDIQLLKGPETAGGAPGWAIFDPVRNRYFRISWVAFQLLSRWHAGTAARLVDLVRAETTCPAETGDVQQLIQFLHASNLTLKSASGSTDDYVEQHNASRPGWLKWLFQNYLFLRFPLVRPDPFFQKINRYLDPLFSRTLRNLVFTLGIFSVFLISRQWESFTSTFLYFFSLEGIFYYLLGIVFVKICHELGHALTATRFGCRVASMGVAFLVFFPVLYTDTTDVYRLTSRRQRIYVSAAGILTEFYLALICLFLWTLLPDGIPRSVVFVLGTVSITLTVLVNMNPFLRFDGYYLLSDVLGLENLQERGFAMGRWQLRRFLLGLTDPPPERHTPVTARFLIAYAWLTWVYRFFLMLGIATVVYFFFFKLLGVILFLGVLYTFILVPALKEFAVWKRHRSRIQPARSVVLGVLFMTLLMLVLVPWRSSIGLPAIAEPRNKATIFAPASGRIVSVQAAVGEQVRQGQTLLVLESPDIDEELRLARIRQSIFESRLRRIAASPDELEDLQVIQQRLQENQTNLAALQALNDQLTIRSPVDGTILELDDSLHPGRWINESLPIALVADPARLVIHGMLNESDLSRVKPAQAARFVPDQVTRPGLDARVVDISQANLAHLDVPYLASVYGGDIAVRQDSQGRLVPESSVYRVTLELEDGDVMADSIVRGVVQVRGEPRSFGQRAYEIIAAALVRGATF